MAYSQVAILFLSMLMRYTHLRAEDLVERLNFAPASVLPLRNFFFETVVGLRMVILSVDP